MKEQKAKPLVLYRVERLDTGWIGGADRWVIRARLFRQPHQEIKTCY